MKLWLISNTGRTFYDMYDSAIIAETTEEKAKLHHPDGYKMFDENGKLCDDDGKRIRYSDGSWVTDLSKIEVELIGNAKKGTKAGVILASFNAG